MENKSVEIYEFRRTFQKHNETFVSFVERLQRQAAKCNFSFPQEHIFAQIIDRCKDSEFRDKALQSDFSYKELIAEGKKVVCPRCGCFDHNFWSPSCEAFNNICLRCNKRGHFSNYCQSKRNVSTERPPNHFSENVSGPSQNEMKPEPIVLQKAIENDTAKLPQNSKAITQSPSTSFPSFTQNLSKENQLVGLKRKRQDSLESCSSSEKFANPKRNAVIAEAAAALTPLVLSPTPKSYYDCFVGGRPMKLIVKTDCPINMISKDQFQKLQKGCSPHYREDELPPGSGFYALFTVKIEVGNESIKTNVFIKESLDSFIYINNETAKKLKLIP